MRTPTAWSRSAWLQRLGYKTGDMPPIAAAFTPTLASGDASELLPPLLAPQGWAGGLEAAHGAGNFSGYEVVCRAVGGSFVKVDASASVQFQLLPHGSMGAAWVPNVPRTFAIEHPGIKSTVTGGHSIASLGTAPVLSLAWAMPGKTSIYIQPDNSLYVLAVADNTPVSMAIHVRDVPVGLAPD